MLAPADFLHLPYDDSLTLAGVEYARHSLHYTYNRMRLNPADRLRKIVAGVAVELAFRRWLDAQHLPYDLLGATAFTEKDRYDLRLGGRRCDLKSFLINHKPRITALRRDPAWLLDAPALIPEDQFRRAALGPDDIYLFGYLAGLETRHSAEVRKAQAARQPVYLLHVLSDERWLGRGEWRSLGTLALKSDLMRPITVEVGGQNAQHEAISERLTLPPRTRVETQQAYYTLLYVRVPRLPSGPLGIHSRVLGTTQLLLPADWHNIWVYGLEIILAGWLPKTEFGARSQKLPAGSPTPLYAHTQTDNRALPVRALRPIAELAERVRKWSAGSGENR